MELTENNKKKK